MFNGMFAIAIYDTLLCKLVLARDAFGIKPLYYLKTEDTFIFASEIKVLREHPNFNVEISNQALSEYLWFGNSLGENTIYRDVKELKAGSFQIIENGTITEDLFFSINDTQRIEIDESQAIEKIKKLLDESVKRHLVSDVPVGVFLSGGIDSSAITALASKHYKGEA